MEAVNHKVLFQAGKSVLPKHARISVRSASPDHLLCTLYDDRTDRVVCNHVNETDKVKLWLENKRALDHPCPQCAKSHTMDASYEKNEYARVGVRQSMPLTPKIQLSPLYAGKISISSFQGQPEGIGMKTVPTSCAVFPGDEDGLYIALQHGVIHRFDTRNQTWDATPILDISEKIKTLPPLGKGMSVFQDERGLLGFAAYPQYNMHTSPYFHQMIVVYGTASRKPDTYDHVSVLSRFRKTSHNTWEERVILEIEQPQMNHNGGTVQFGPSVEDSRSGNGYLYYGVGDGGGFNDQHGELLDLRDKESFLGNGQNWSTLLGKLLRIDVHVPFEGHTAYLIPRENPKAMLESTEMIEPEEVTFTGSMMQLRDEIYAGGLRNPFNFGFDRPTGRLFIPDVGQDKKEEVNLIEDTSIPLFMPANFGWRALEGGKELTEENIFNRTVLSYIGGYNATIPPILEYDRTDRSVAAVIGGGVYRGHDMPALRGSYLFGDYNGQIFYAREDKETGEWNMHSLISHLGAAPTSAVYLHTFGFDSFGEMYALIANLQKDAMEWSIQKLTATDLSSVEIRTLLTRARDASASGNILSELRRDVNDHPTTPKMHISVMTREGHVETLSMRDAWQGSWDISRSKAYAALAFSSDENALTSRAIGELSQTGPWSGTDPNNRPPLHNIGTSNPAHGVTEFPGGLPIYKDGKLVGGIGVSGDTPTVDEAVAKAALPPDLWPSASIRIDNVTKDAIQYTK